MRFAIGGISHESNTFCPKMTTLEHFKIGGIHSGKDIIKILKGSQSFYGGVIDAAHKLGVELYPTIASGTNPYGIVEKEAFNYLTEKLYEKMKEAEGINGVVLCLHGGMVAENSFDPEGEMIKNIREIFSPNVPIACTLDMHSKISQRMIENCNAFFVNNENPHLDSHDRGVEATQVLYQILKGKFEPVMALKKPRMLPPTLHVNPPHSGPMVALFKKAFEMEKNPKVINVNIVSGFPWSDVPDAGMAVLPVVNKDEKLAEELAEELSQKLWEVRHDFIPSLPKVDEALERAMSAERGPVILADVADNPGDGTTEDSTAILKALINNNVKDVSLAVIHDPEALEECISSGVGNIADLNLGCKSRVFGEPVKIKGVVKTLSDGGFRFSGPQYRGHELRIGRVAVLEKDGIDIIITERTHNPIDPEIFRRHGIDPSKKKILVVKTFKMHMESNYRPFAKEIIEVDAPGQASINMKSFKWRRIPRPMFPIDDF